MLKILSMSLTALVLAFFATGTAQAANLRENPNAKQFKFSTTIEKERPELDEETRQLISVYRKNPTKANYAALRKKVEENYDKIVARKKAKLTELKRTAGRDKIDEMQVIVDEMLRDRENRITQSMNRFSDKRMRPNARENVDGFLPVLGVAENVNIGYTEVSNADYAKFVQATGRKAPKNWAKGTFPRGQENFPVVFVSYNDAVAYCQWLSQQDHSAKYRLPTETEWEYAAGHMPKDADMNVGENPSAVSVDEYAQTKSASGAINMWGNVWEWTSTDRTKTTKAVKGGAWNSKRTDCRTEARSEGRKPNQGYENVGFRVIKEK